MTGCTHRLADDPAGLPCTRDEHDDQGHVYVSTSGVAHCPKEEA